VPLDPKTHHLIGSTEFGIMKPTAALINTSRGPVVDQEALYKALKFHQIFVTEMDVTETEPISPDDPLLNRDNVIITRHVASASVITRTKTAKIAVENLIGVLRGETSPNCVTLESIKPRAKH